MMFSGHMASVARVNSTGVKMRLCLISGAVIASLFVFAGCGDAPSSSGGTSGTPASGSYASDSLNNTLAECLSCHIDEANPPGLNNVTGDSAASKAAGEGWLSSSHANYEESPTYLGYPPYAGWLSSSCRVCHDPLEDGRTIDDYADATGRSDVGIIERPVVGCAGCHGSGEDHFGEGPMEYSNPGPEQCASVCHNDDYPHVDRHSNPAGDRIYEDFVSSAHNSSDNSHVLFAGGLDLMCAKCHTDEGARMYRDTSVADLYGQYSDMDYGSVECRTCHDAHNPANLLKDDIDDGSGNILNSAQFATCTACHPEDVASENQAYANYNDCSPCHQVQRALHGVESDFAWGPQGIPPIAGVGNFDGSTVFYDTHYDLNSTTVIEGYVMNASSPDVCIDCHNVHSVDNEINDQWARSGHGGHILDIKERAFLNTSDDDPDVAKTNAYNVINGTDRYGAQGTDSSDEYYTGAWSFGHYDFKTTYGGGCLRCKTATGLKEFMSDPVGFNAYMTSYVNSTKPGKFFTQDDQREVLYCWGCHTSSAGALRDPLDAAGVSFTNLINGDYAEPSGRMANVPDAGGSNICMSCHSGRYTGAQIKTDFIDDASVANTSFGDYSPHYLSAGGTLFRVTGYEYHPDSDYDDYSWFTHDRIGIDISGTGENGPCVGCHMRSDEGHTFEASIRNATSITNIPTFDQTCSVCHGDEAALITDMNDLYEGFEEALDVLKTKLEANEPALSVSTRHPYFVNSGAPGMGEAFIEWPDRDTVGAAFNYNLMYHHEEGAYVHNSRYARRLIFDSIDFLEDGLLNGVIASGYINNATAYDYLNNGMRP